MKMKWTVQEEDILEKMVVAGKSPQDVVAVLKSRSVDSVRQKSEKMKLIWVCSYPEIDLKAFKEKMGDAIKERKSR